MHTTRRPQSQKMDKLSFLQLAKKYAFDRSANTPENKMTQAAFDKNEGLRFVFIQIQLSPYSAKVRAYLDYCRIDYGLAEVDIFSKVDYKHFSESGKVPILIAVEASGTAHVVNESSYIISALESWRRTGDIEHLKKVPKDADVSLRV